MRKVFVAVVAGTLAASPVAAQSVDRTPAPTESAPSEQLGGSPWITIAIVFAILAGILLLTGGSDNPSSP